MDIVILAGGAGRRFGGTKQFIPVGPDGASLMEVTLRHGLRAGCDRAVIVTSPALEDELRELVRRRPMAGLEVAIALQEADDLPAPAPARTKPWGTAHALWAARHEVRDSFLLFNADDHYGPRAPGQLIAALDHRDQGPVFALLGYRLGNTLSPGGNVSRALCRLDEDGFLLDLQEYPAIDARGSVATGPMVGQALDRDALVSMNAWAFTPDIFPILEDHLKDFLATADLEADECYLPAAVHAAIGSGRVRVRVPEARDRWFGMTWTEDREQVVKELAERAAAEDVARAILELETAPVVAPLGDGLIHRTWEVGGTHVLQRLNTSVFGNPEAMVLNADLAARQVDLSLAAAGDTDPRHRLVFSEVPGGGYVHRDEAGRYWRLSRLIPAARPATEQEARKAAGALGRFPGLAAGVDFAEILPGFHDTSARLEAFRTTVKEDPHGRAGTCPGEIAFLEEQSDLAHRLADLDLPLRPTHNDAKLDNVLVDTPSGEALCVIDLDTVMPGLAAWDFGDLVRSAVTGLPEDEPDLENIIAREGIFRELAAGYLDGARGWITPAERDSLVDGALVITFEQALRFLTDHLAGDVYYPVSGDGHNLRRARAQLRLLAGLLDKQEAWREIVAEIS